VQFEITSHSEALTCALVLAIVTPSDSQFAECVELAESFASWLTDEEIEQAKAQAVIEARRWPN